MGSYTINEFGEIERKDYFFQAAKEGNKNPLPSSRSVFVVYLLNFITLGIYGLVLNFNMARETNITCEADGKHTRNFWGAFLLTAITLGIYGIVWNYQWLNRESNFLRNHGRDAKLTGGAFIVLFIVYAVLYCLSITVAPVFVFGELVWGIVVMALVVSQHNLVNQIHNLENFPHK